MSLNIKYQQTPKNKKVEIVAYKWIQIFAVWPTLSGTDNYVKTVCYGRNRCKIVFSTFFLSRHG